MGPQTLDTRDGSTARQGRREVNRYRHWAARGLVAPGGAPVSRWAYRPVTRLWNLEMWRCRPNGIRRGQCERPGCRRLFVKKHRGRPRRWCSDRCRMRDSRSRQ